MFMFVIGIDTMQNFLKIRYNYNRFELKRKKERASSDLI